MNNIKQAFLSGLVFLGTVITGFIAFATYTSLPTQGDGATITQTIWNDVINKINTIGNNVDTLTGSRLGVGQTRQNLTASRVNNTNYVNNTGKPINVSINTNNLGDSNITVIIDGVTILDQWRGGGSVVYAELLTNFIVPNGSTYKVNATAGIQIWSELR